MIKKKLSQRYRDLEIEYSLVKNKEDKIKILQLMLKEVPNIERYKKLRADITHKIRLLKEKIKKEEEREELIKKSRKFFKTDEFTIALVGDANTGKTYLLNKLCNTNYESTEIPYETRKPLIGEFKRDGVKIRVVEIPSSFKPNIRRILEESDLIIIMPESNWMANQIKEWGIETPIKILKEFPKTSWEFFDLNIITIFGEKKVIFKGTTLADLDLKTALVNGERKESCYILKDGDVID